MQETPQDSGSPRTTEKVVLVRHGQTSWSLAGRHTGRTDAPLLPSGEAQAETIGRRLRGWRFALVLTSPLSRALATCRIAGYGDVAQPDPDLEEWDYGDYEGLTTAQIRRGRSGWSLFDDGAPAGEDAAAVGVRADRVLERVRAADGPVALFAHGHILRVIAVRWIGLPPREGRSLALSTASVSTLGFERETPVLLSWNQTSHVG